MGSSRGETLSRRKDPVARFWSRVRIAGPDDCWERQGYCHPDGHGMRYVGDGRRPYTHRYAWELTFGEIPDGKCVCPSCDNPPGCNPKPLFRGTRGENTLDM